LKILQNLEKSYCFIDNFVKSIEKNLLFSLEKRGRKSTLSVSELVTLGLLRMELKMESIKAFHAFIKLRFSKDFPKLPSYQQFCEGLTAAFPYIVMITQIIMEMHKMIGGFYIVDSTALPICSSILRKNRVKRDNGLGKVGKNLNGFYFGFKMHAIINQNMQFVSIRFTPANVSDTAVLDEKFLRGLHGVLVGDKGYISSTKTVELRKMGITLVTKQRKNMRKTPIHAKHAKALTKRQRVETSFSSLKNQFLFISRYARSLRSFLAQSFFSVLVYSMQKLNFDAFTFSESPQFLIS